MYGFASGTVARRGVCVEARASQGERISWIDTTPTSCARRWPFHVLPRTPAGLTEFALTYEGRDADSCAISLHVSYQ